MLPFDDTDLDTETVTVERRVAAVPATHPLAVLLGSVYSIG